MSEWQPIETAPERVSYFEQPVDVLLWGPSLGVRAGRAGRIRGYVHADVANMNGNIAGEIATHWMPLPEPPK